MNNLNTPVYKVLKPTDDTEGVFFISLVEEPAIESDWIVQSKYKEIILFSSEKSKQMLYGAVLIPNKIIPRIDENGDKYNIVWDAKVIEKVSQKFNRENLSKNINIQHSQSNVDGYIAESWIVDNPLIDKSKTLGLNVPKGTWMVGVKIDDKSFFNNEILSKNLKGFSVEALIKKMEFSKIQIKQNKNMLSEIKDKILSIFKDVDNQEKQEVKQEVVEYTTADGQVISFNDEYLMLGDVKLPYGEYLLEDGTYLSYNNTGMIVQEEVKQETSEITLESGDIILIDDKGLATLDGVTVGDGEYTTADGQMLIITGGMIVDKNPITDGDGTEKLSKTFEEKFSKYNEDLNLILDDIKNIKQQLDVISKQPVNTVNIKQNSNVAKVQVIGQSKEEDTYAGLLSLLQN